MLFSIQINNSKGHNSYFFSTDFQTSLILNVEINMYMTLDKNYQTSLQSQDGFTASIILCYMLITLHLSMNIVWNWNCRFTKIPIHEWQKIPIWVTESTQFIDSYMMKTLSLYIVKQEAVKATASPIYQLLFVSWHFSISHGP